MPLINGETKGTHVRAVAPVLLSAPVTVTDHAPGMPHVRATIAKMAALAREGSHSYEIRNLATRITRDVPSKSPTREIAAIYKWVRDEIRYRHDPLGLEWVQSPARTVAEGAGDCDDMTTLIVALCGALGHRWQFRTVGRTPEVQAHVAAQVHDKKRWIDVDPVLEAEQPTTAARPNDLGTFALRAPGADRLWSDGGAMLRGTGYLGAPANRADRALWNPYSLGQLGAPTTAADRELWLFAPYFPQLPPYGGDQPPQPGVWPPNTPAYKILALPTGMIDERRVRAAQLAGLGGLDYFDPLSGLHGKVLRKLKAVGQKIKKGLAKVPGLKQVAKAVVGIIPGASTIIDSAKGVAQVAKGVKKAVKTGKAIKAVAKGKKPAAPPPGTKGKVVALAKKPPAPKKPAPKPAVAARALPPKPVAIARPASRPAAGPTARPSYPAGARMRFDAGAGVYRVYAPLSGLGGIRPTLTFALGGLGNVPKAKAAVSAVQAFIAKNKKPPQVALPAVKTFQAAVPGLTPDGLWGSNTAAAARHYAGGTVPPTAPGPKFSGKVTWKPPAKAAAPKPAAAKKPGAAPSAGAPAGYKEIAATKANPGLPPVGWQPGAAAPPAAAVQVLPAGGGDAPPSVEPADLPDEPMPADVPGDQPLEVKIGKVKIKRNAPTPGWEPAGTSTMAPVIPLPVAQLPTTTTPAPAGFDTHPGLPLPMPAGPYASQSEYDASRAQLYPGAGAGGAGSGKTNPWVWAALAYLYTRTKKAA